MESHCHWYKYQAEISSGYESVWEYMEKPQNLNPSYDASMKQAFSRYVNCIHSPDVTSALKYCIPKIQKQCQSSSIIAAKILRVNIWNLDFILNDHPDWKVVHQIRDPRGILISQRSSGIMTKYSKGSIIAESNILCDKMLNDTRSFKLHKNTHQGQYMLVKYEDYADAPVQTAQEIYSHIGSEVNDEVILAIKELTHASHDSGAMDQRRKNSSETARKWTTKMTSIEKKWIDKSCSDFYKESGYREDVNLRPMFYRPISFVDDLRGRNGRDWLQDYHTQNRIRNGEFGAHRVNVNPSDEKIKSRHKKKFYGRSQEAETATTDSNINMNTETRIMKYVHINLYMVRTQAIGRWTFLGTAPTDSNTTNMNRETRIMKYVHINLHLVRTQAIGRWTFLGTAPTDSNITNMNRETRIMKYVHINLHLVRTQAIGKWTFLGIAPTDSNITNMNRETRIMKYVHINLYNGWSTGNRQIAVSKNSAHRTDNHQFRGYPRNSNSVLRGNIGGNAQENYVRHIGGETQ